MQPDGAARYLQPRDIRARSEKWHMEFRLSSKRLLCSLDFIFVLKSSIIIYFICMLSYNVYVQSRTDICSRRYFLPMLMEMRNCYVVNIAATIALASLMQVIRNSNFALGNVDTNVFKK